MRPHTVNFDHDNLPQVGELVMHREGNLFAFLLSEDRSPNIGIVTRVEDNGYCWVENGTAMLEYLPDELCTIPTAKRGVYLYHPPKAWVMHATRSHFPYGGSAAPIQYVEAILAETPRGAHMLDVYYVIDEQRFHASEIRAEAAVGEAAAVYVDDILPPEVHNRNPIDGGRALKITRDMCR